MKEQKSAPIGTEQPVERLKTDPSLFAVTESSTLDRPHLQLQGNHKPELPLSPANQTSPSHNQVNL